MAERGVAFSKQAARRIVDRIRLGEATPTDLTGRVIHQDHLPRDYRPFELAAELNGGSGELAGGAGATADCKFLRWDPQAEEFVDSGETGEVVDMLGNSYGLEGERGEAVFFGGKWYVHINPGQPVYEGSAAADIASGASTANITVAIDGNNRTVSCSVPSGAVSAGKKYASGSKVFIAHTRGTWKIMVFVVCEVTA